MRTLAHSIKNPVIWNRCSQCQYRDYKKRNHAIHSNGLCVYLLVSRHYFLISHLHRSGLAGDNGSESESEFWQGRGFPQYLHEGVNEFCDDYELALQNAVKRAVAQNGDTSAHSVWKTVRREAQADAAGEPLLSSFLYASILSHENFERSLAFVLSNRLSDATLLPTELFEVFYSTLKNFPEVAGASLADLCATRERDPACKSYSQALLYYKGFHAIQCQRIAHELWKSGRRVMSLMLQSRMSEVFAVDIHPAAKIGRGVLLDHGTGVVIGETAEIGNNVSILQNVTLGGTGKEHGDRHPKISDNVLIGASATILGGIRVGKGAQVAAGSLVLKPVAPRTMVAGSPAKEVGIVTGNPAAKMEQWSAECEEALHAKLSSDPFAVPSEMGQVTVSTGPPSNGKVQRTPSKPGQPPKEIGPVDAVTSDKQANKKWPTGVQEPPEYII